MAAVAEEDEGEEQEHEEKREGIVEDENTPNYIPLHMARSETACRYCGVSYLIFHEFHQLHTRLAQLEAELQEVGETAQREKAQREALELGRLEWERALHLEVQRKAKEKEKNMKEELKEKNLQTERALRDEFEQNNERKRKEMEEEYQKISEEKEGQLRRELGDLEVERLRKQQEELERRAREREKVLSDALQKANKNSDELRKYHQQLEERLAKAVSMKEDAEWLLGKEKQQGKTVREQRRHREEQQQEETEHREKLLRTEEVNTMLKFTVLSGCLPRVLSKWEILIESHGRALTKMEEDYRLASKSTAALEKEQTQNALQLTTQMEELRRELTIDREKNQLLLLQYQRDRTQLQQKVASLQETVRRECEEREELTAALSQAQQKLLGQRSLASHQGSSKSSAAYPPDTCTPPGSKHFHLQSQARVTLTRSSTSPNTLRLSPACTVKDRGRDTDGRGAGRRLESWNGSGVLGRDKRREGILPRLKAGSTESEVKQKVSLVMGRKERL
ncbi:hypothetical protein PAMP_018792 [Pampus punctatissimus]